MQSDFFVSGLDHVQHYMTSILVYAFPITEPFATVLGCTFDYTIRFMNATISACMRRQIVEIVRFYFLVNTSY